MLRAATFRKASLITVLVLLIVSQSGLTSAAPGSWISHGPEGGRVYALAVDPSAPATLYAGTYGGGVFVSTNRGGSWSAYNTGLIGSRINALAIAPATLYAGTSGGGVSVTAIQQATRMTWLPLIQRGQ